MKDKLQEKLYGNALVSERLRKLSNEEKQIIILELCKTKSERALGEELGIPHSTIHDWRTLRQKGKGEFVHISLSSIYIKLKALDVESPKFTDWGRLVQIKDVCENLLRKKNV